jgi:hypothetical protein
VKKVYSAAKAREDFSNIIKMGAFMGSCVVIERYGQPLVEINPVKKRRVVDFSDLRVYSDSEVDQFIKEDQLTSKERKDAQNYLKNLS